MNTNYDENNHLVLVGKVTSEKRFSHEVYGEKFYNFDLSVPRLSGNADLIPITISERLLTNKDIEMDSKVTVIGQFRSYNSYDNDRNRLILTVFAKDITFAEDQENDVKVGKDIVSNEVVLNGYICKKPIYRKTPFGREISDILLAVNRAYNKSDYIPCIAWEEMLVSAKIWKLAQLLKLLVEFNQELMRRNMKMEQSKQELLMKYLLQA